MVNQRFYFFPFRYMNKAFTAGALAGVGSLVVAVPLIAQLSFAADDDVSAMANHAVPSQECLLAMVDLEDAHLAHVDEMTAFHTEQMQKHRDALAEIAAISDDTERADALKQMREDMRTNKEDMTPPEDVQAAMDAAKEACGNTMMFGHGPGHGGPGMHGMMDEGRGPEKLAELLGMTTDELRAALDSGTTIEELASQKGVELPARPEGGPRGHMPFMGMMRGGEDQ